MNDAVEQSAEVRDAAPSRAQDLLLEFLREHDAACPVCGYNLKTLTRPICPECGQELVLTVGAARLRLGWLLAALAPGFFSGIAAVFVLVPVVAQPVFGDGRISLTLIGADLFGWCSGVFAILLAAKRHRFLAQPRATQRWWALGIWFVHVAALGLLFLVGPRYL
jgi:hypothetical protein